MKDRNSDDTAPGGVARSDPADTRTQGDRPAVTILMPVFNDWTSLAELLRMLDQTAFGEIGPLRVLVVDDNSSAPMPEDLGGQSYSQIASVDVLRLRRNLGHQRAIAVGLCYVHDSIASDYIIVMDGDGEDDGPGAAQLLQKAIEERGTKVVFARRSRRSEGVIFRVCYFFYRQLHRLLVGRTMTVGNFSVLPSQLNRSIVVVSDIWNHYSAGIRHARVPYLEVKLPRAKRLAGKSKMNLVGLVTHGLSSIAVYSETVGTRVILGITALLAVVMGLLLTVVGIRLLTELAVPGWATYTSGLLAILMSQLVLIGVVYSMIILSSRHSADFVPIRDYHHFVAEHYRLSR